MAPGTIPEVAKGEVNYFRFPATYKGRVILQIPHSPQGCDFHILNKLFFYIIYKDFILKLFSVHKHF